MILSDLLRQNSLMCIMGNGHINFSRVRNGSAFFVFKLITSCSCWNPILATYEDCNRQSLDFLLKSECYFWAPGDSRLLASSCQKRPSQNGHKKITCRYPYQFKVSHPNRYSFARFLPPRKLSYPTDFINNINMGAHGTFDALGEFKKTSEWKGKRRCQFRRLQKNLIKGSVFVTIVESRCNGMGSTGPSWIPFICFVLFAHAGGSRKTGITSDSPPKCASWGGGQGETGGSSEMSGSACYVIQ